MSYYNVCPRCGAHLDPGEPCDCMAAEGAGGQTEDGEKEEEGS